MSKLELANILARISIHMLRGLSIRDALEKIAEELRQEYFEEAYSNEDDTY